MENKPTNETAFIAYYVDETEQIAVIRLVCRSRNWQDFGVKMTFKRTLSIEAQIIIFHYFFALSDSIVPGEGFILH